MEKKNEILKTKIINNILENNMNTSRLIFQDKVNVKKAKYVYNLTLQDFKYKFWNKLEVDENGRGYELKVFYNEVRKLCNEVIRHKVEGKEYALIKRKYRFSDNKSGRIYSCGFGIQSLQGNLRKFLTGDYLLDIDIKNAHPNILYELVLEYNKKHKNGLSKFYLESYCKNREQILKQNNFTKEQFLICLNSDEIQTNKKNKGFYTKNSFLLGFHSEKMKIFNAIINNTDYIKKYEIETKNDKNPISSLVNKLFCIKENDIIQSVMKSDICVPMFDGFMFPKEEKEQYDYLLEKEGNIQWSYKENLINIQMDDFDETESKDYLSLKEEFEKNHCLILTKPLIFLRKQLNEKNKLEDVLFDKKSMLDICEPLQVINDEGKEEPFLNRWLKDKARLCYNKFDFNPYVTKDKDTTLKHIYNTFNEFDVSLKEKYKKPEWFLNFLFENAAAEDEKSYNYLLYWLAHLFQKPFENPMVSLVLRGESGIGKDTLIEIIEKMIGKLNDYIHRTPSLKDIFTKEGFNADLKNKLLIQFNEVEGKDGSEAKELIKDQITRTTNIIKEKYINNYKQKNLARCVFITNQNSPIPFRYDERRFMLFKFSSKNKGRTKYWNDIYEKMEDIEELNNIYNYLMKEVDLTNINLVDDRPKTEAYLIAISNATPVHMRWLNYIFGEYENQESIDYRNDIFDNKKHFYFTIPSNLYNYYKSWLSNEHIDYEFKSIQFKKILQDIDGVECDKKIRYKGKPSRVILFDLHKIRDELRKYTFSISEEEEEFNLDNL